MKEGEKNSKEKLVSPDINIDISDFEEDRYHRLRLIPWWDQEKMKNARVMVVGAGALGNEIIKNLALLGVGNILIVDFDEIESSNLTRAVLFRSGDEKTKKAETAAKRAREINPDINVAWLHCNINYDLGLGVYRNMNVVIGGLDNREARLSINQSCWKVRRPWVDGAIEVLHGVARVFIPPDSACYECTMNEIDYLMLNKRKSCALLTKEDMLQGKIPTTPTVSSIIGGIQVQEALKIIHDRAELQPMKGEGFVYNGLTFDSYKVVYSRKEDCLSHNTFENIIELDKSVKNTTLREMLEIVRKDLGPEAVLELDKELVTALVCNKCNKKSKVFKSMGKVTVEDAKCPDCCEIRELEMTHLISGGEDFLDLTMNEAGIPLWEIVAGRAGMDIKYYELASDSREIFE